MVDSDNYYELYIRATERVYQQVKLMWDDQVELAQTLVNKRRYTSTLLAILIGLGFFRVQIFKRTGDQLVLEGGSFIIIKVSLILSLLLACVGTYWLYTDRPLARKLFHRFIDSFWRWVMLLWKKARASSPEESSSVTLDPPSPTPWPSFRAIEHLLPDDEEVGDWFQLPEVDLIKMQTRRLRLAYKDLRTQNRRVARRIKEAIFCLFISFVLLFVAAGVYVVSI